MEDLAEVGILHVIQELRARELNDLADILQLSTGVCPPPPPPQTLIDWKGKV